MRLTSSILLAAAAALSRAHTVDERSFEGGVLEARDTWTKGNCYSSAGSLALNGTSIYQSQGACSLIASGKGDKVIGLTDGNVCYTGGSLPSDSDKVDESKCSVACVGYPSDNCGAKGFWRIYTTGVVASSGSSNSDSDSQSSSADSSPSPSTTAAPATTAISVVTSAGATQTVVITNSADNAAAPATISVSAPTDTNSADKKSGGTNTAAIAAGVVVGVVGAAAIAGAIWFWLRSRKHREEAAELQRQNSIAGLRSEKPPSTYSMPDSRLEPAYMRRISDGSIADNQDYSRRILKVTNPDGR